MVRPSRMVRLSRLRGAAISMASLVPGLAFCLPATPPQPAPLHDAQPFHLHGKLEIEYRGWHRYLAVRLDHPLAVDFGPGEPAQHVASIELNPLDKYDTVAAQVGGVVDAEGPLRINAASPFYLNGVMLMAESVRLPDGALLHPGPARLPDPPETQGYMVTVTMTPHHFQWQRDAVDLATGKPLETRAAFDGCSLNGGGDVMNCSCTSGFEPVRAGVVAAPLSVEEWMRVPVPETDAQQNGVAQFALPDPDAKHPQIVQVVCRSAASMPASKLP